MSEILPRAGHKALFDSPMASNDGEVGTRLIIFMLALSHFILLLMVLEARDELRMYQ